MRNCVGGFFLKVAGRPELPVLTPFLPFATDRFAASESEGHPGGGGVFDP